MTLNTLFCNVSNFWAPLNIGIYDFSLDSTLICHWAEFATVSRVEIYTGIVDACVCTIVDGKSTGAGASRITFCTDM